LPRELIASTLAAFVLFGAVAVHSQGPADWDALAIARLAVNEAGFEPTDDIAGIYAVVARRARLSGISIDSAARIQSPRVYTRRRCEAGERSTRERPCRRRRLYVPFLPFDGHRPRRWPRRMEWPRDKWMALLARAQRLVSGQESHGCSEEPRWWGGPVVDRASIDRNIANGTWHIVDCGRTENVFLAPGRGE
jgi:hypothetical protein